MRPEESRAMWAEVVRTFSVPLGSFSWERMSTVAVKGALGMGVTKMPGIYGLDSAVVGRHSALLVGGLRSEGGGR